jgi:hypothetical protein
VCINAIIIIINERFGLAVNFSVSLASPGQSDVLRVRKTETENSLEDFEPSRELQLGPQNHRVRFEIF